MLPCYSRVSFVVETFTKDMEGKCKSKAVEWKHQQAEIPSSQVAIAVFCLVVVCSSIIRVRRVPQRSTLAEKCLDLNIRWKIGFGRRGARSPRSQRHSKWYYFVYPLSGDYYCLYILLLVSRVLMEWLRVVTISKIGPLASGQITVYLGKTRLVLHFWFTKVDLSLERSDFMNSSAIFFCFPTNGLFYGLAGLFKILPESGAFSLSLFRCSQLGLREKNTIVLVQFFCLFSYFHGILDLPGQPDSHGSS